MELTEIQSKHGYEGSKSYEKTFENNFSFPLGKIRGKELYLNLPLINKDMILQINNAVTYSLLENEK